LIQDKKIRGAKEEFSYYENYKDKVTNIFTLLSNLQKEIDDADKKDEGDIRRKYAYYLLYKGVLDHIRSLSSDDYEYQKPVSGKPQKKETAKPAHDEQWLKIQLMKKFREWVYSVYKSFYWKKDWITKENAANKAWDKYNEFVTNRKMQFISEAEEVPLLDSMDEPC